MSEARERIALSLSQGGKLAIGFIEKVDSESLLLTSSGSEANQLAIRSALHYTRSFRLQDATRAQSAAALPHWITSPTEHDSVLQMVKALGIETSFLPVDQHGRVDVEAIDRLWRPETRLVSLSWVNNETGVIADVARAAEIVRSRGGIFHVDAAQAWGKLPIHAPTVGAHFITLSAHKIGALAGTGVLWCAPGSKVSPTILGKQEKGRRGGTENVLGAVAAGTAATEVSPETWAGRVAPLRDRLERETAGRIPGSRVNGSGAPRVANTLNLSFDGVEGDGLVMALDLAGFSVSSGSACSSGALEPSHVLLAMGRTREQATAAVRISLSDAVEWAELEKFVSALERTVVRMRQAQSRYGNANVQPTL
jgi:cysteine desulfurase